MTEINLYNKDNYLKCEALKKIGYYVEIVGSTCVINNKNIKNYEQFANIYYNSVNDVVLFLKNDLRKAGYNVVA